jgi:ATP-dependent DNA helicase RecQ
LVRLGLLERAADFGNLRLTATGRDALRGKDRVWVPANAQPLPERAVSEQTRDLELFEKLRSLRSKLASAGHVPAYVIFSDRALLEMATSKPSSETEFLAVNGVGRAKLANYGPEFLRVIRQHCGARAAASSTSAASPPVRVAGRRTREIAGLFADGLTIDEIAARYHTQTGTVVSHLVDYQQLSGGLDPGFILAASRLAEEEKGRVLEAFGRLGTERLAPIREALGASVSYEELHLLRLYVLCRQKTVAGVKARSASDHIK